MSALTPGTRVITGPFMLHHLGAVGTVDGNVCRDPRHPGPVVRIPGGIYECFSPSELTVIDDDFDVSAEFQRRQAAWGRGAPVSAPLFDDFDPDTEDARLVLESYAAEQAGDTERDERGWR